MTDIQDVIAKLPPELQPVGGTGGFERVHGGRNNQVFAYQCADGERRILKLYNPAVIGDATRLEREFSFLRLIWGEGRRDVPQPLHADAEHHAGIYSFIEGERFAEGWAERWGVDAASEFLTACQALRSRPQAREVPEASEACFSLATHAATLERRLMRLKEIERGEGIQTQAERFFEETLHPAAARAVAGLRAVPGAGRELAAGARWLSPSDFGFHNALKTGPGSLAFLDFEHAGWDDPAKLIVDFTNQPDHVLPDELAAVFEEAVTAEDPDSDALRSRVRLLRPVYQLKWACILLNEFLPFGSERRLFLGREADGRAEAEKERQLGRARQMVERALAGMEANFE